MTTTNDLSINATESAAAAPVANAPWPEGQRNEFTLADKAMEVVQMTIDNNINPSREFLDKFRNRTGTSFKPSLTMSDSVRRAVTWARNALIGQFAPDAGAERAKFEKALRQLEARHPAPLRETGLRTPPSVPAKVAPQRKPEPPRPLPPPTISGTEAVQRLMNATGGPSAMLDILIRNKRFWIAGTEDAIIGFYSTKFWNELLARSEGVKLSVAEREDCHKRAAELVAKAIGKAQPRGRRDDRNRGRKPHGQNRGNFGRRNDAEAEVPRKVDALKVAEPLPADEAAKRAMAKAALRAQRQKERERNRLSPGYGEMKPKAGKSNAAAEPKISKKKR